jgi:RNA polymerase sigma factor (sigma-70 family)
MSEPVTQLVDHLFRHESGKMVSVLTKILGMKNLEVAHDIVQDTLLKAMTQWRYGNVPTNPPAWLYAVARNRAIDYLRAQRSSRKITGVDGKVYPEEVVELDNMFLESEIQDSVLRMIFACCHPSIPEESQIALSLKTLCGLSVYEIAKAFLTSEDTIAKRIYRAREKIQNEKIELEVPSASSLKPRLDNVLRVLYLLFNEGYNSSHPDELIREDICAEAMRLCHSLTQHHVTNIPATNALLSLMCFQSSRLLSRIDELGNIITLKYQDRSSWNQALISKGRDYLDRAAEGEAFSVYHLEAAIAALHASAHSFEQTDWKSVYDLYEILYSMRPSPVVALNKAIASAYAVSHQSALDQLKLIKGLEKHYLYHAALGEVCLALDKKKEALYHFENALQLTSSKSEQQLLKHKMEAAEL